MDQIKQKIIRSKRDISSLVEGELVKIGIAYPEVKWYAYKGKKGRLYSFITFENDNKLLELVKIPSSLLDKLVKKEKLEVERRKSLYRENKNMINVQDKTVVLVDDGVATGISSTSAIKYLKKLNPKKIIFAAPVCALDSIGDIKRLVDEFVCLETPPEFNAVGSWYNKFDQVSDEEVRDLLRKSLEFTK